MTSTTHYDVIVVGAGLAGLSAAHTLESRLPEAKVLVLEAKDRVGGRTFTADIECGENKTAKWDLGGQWLSPAQKDVWDLTQRLGLKTYRQFSDGRKLLQLDPREVKSYTGTIPRVSILQLIRLQLMEYRVDRMAKTVNLNNWYETPNAAELDGQTLESFINAYLPAEESRSLMKIACRVTFGAEPREMSALYFLAYVASSGGIKNLFEEDSENNQGWVIEGGSQQISIRLAAELREKVQLKTAVKKIERKDETIEITTETGEIHTCNHVITAIPPSQLIQLQWTPRLNTEKQFVYENAPMGNLIKYIITFENAFWKTKGDSGNGLSFGGNARLLSLDNRDSLEVEGPLSCVFDHTLPGGEAALVAFCGGDRSIFWRSVSAERRQAAVIQCLADMYGPQTRDFIAFEEKDWNEEAYSGGCPVCFFKPGTGRYYCTAMRHRHGNVHFAGTETATRFTGFMSGAVHSGYRAAFEVLCDVEPATVTSEERNYHSLGEERGNVGMGAAARQAASLQDLRLGK